MTEAKTFKLIYISFFFVALGVFVSVSVPALYHVLAAVPLGYLSWLYLFKEHKSLPKSSWALIVFVLVGYATSLINFNTLNNPVRSLGKQKYELFAVMTFIALTYMREFMTPTRWRRLLSVFLFTVVAAGLYSAWAVLSGDVARAGGFTKIMRYGYGTGFVLSMMIGCIPFLKKGDLFNKRLFWTALFAGAMGMFFAKTRGSFLGVAVSIPVIVWFFRRRLAYSLILMGGLFIASLLYVAQTGNYGDQNRFMMKLGNTSNLHRMSQYETAFRTFLEKPIFGHGVNQFSSLCKKQKEKYNIYWPKYCDRFEVLQCENKGGQPYCGHSHNIFLETMANRGVLGVLALCAFLFFWAREMWQRRDAMTVVMFGLISNLVVAGQFEYVFDANNSFMLFFVYSCSFFPLPERFKLWKSREEIL